MAEKSGGKNQHLDSGKKLQTQESHETSENLSKDLALELMSLIKKVNAKEVTPGTVNAACNCASQIHKILKLNLEMKKEGY